MYFPLFLDLSHKEILVVGSGMIARRRIRTLLDFAGHITIVAPHAAKNIHIDAAKGAAADDPRAARGSTDSELSGVTFLERCFEERDLDGKDLVIAATDDARLNNRISEKCRERGILVNVCTGVEDCDFLFPSVIEEKQVVIGVNASGRDHSLVKNTRKQIEELLEIREGLYPD